MSCINSKEKTKLLSIGALPGSLEFMVDYCPNNVAVILNQLSETNPAIKKIIQSLRVKCENTDISYLKNNNATNMGYMIHGADEYDFSGSSVAVGDVNGDGIADIIIGAHGASADTGGAFREGETYVIYGKSGISTQNIDLSYLKNNNAMSMGYIIHGADDGNFNGDKSGSSVAVGDVNGDGISDIIIGAPEAKKDYGGNNLEGETYVIYGKSGSVTNNVDLSYLKNNNATNIGYIIHGADDYDRSGSSLVVGDVNDDGIADIIIGAFFAGVDTGDGNNEGETYVIYGKLGSGTNNIDLSYLKNNNATNIGYIIHGADNNDNSGYSIAVGDINDDGVSDIIIGAVVAEKDSGGGNSEGETYVIYGKSGSITNNIDLSYLKNNNATNIGYIIHGEDENDLSGSSVAVGDINGDSISDIIIGAIYANKDSGGDSSEGETYVVYGKSGSVTNNIDLSYLKNNNATNMGYIIHGADENDESGRSIAVGDVNGDGISDIIIGARGANKDSDGDSREGETYVIYGKLGISTQNIDLSYLKNNNATSMGYIVHGADENDESGRSIAVGDVNGDGVSDIIIGAIGAEKDILGGIFEGATYVIYGQNCN